MLQKLDKRNYPETRQAVALVILDNYGTQISKDLKAILDKVTTLGYYQIDDLVNNKNPLFEGIYSKERLYEIRREYFRFTRRVLKENPDSIEKNLVEGIEMTSLDIHGRNEVKNFLALKTGDIRKTNFNNREKFEIAKSLAYYDGEGLSNYIKFYGLSQEQRYEIAKISVTSNSYRTIFNIKNFDLTQEERFEIAKIAAIDGLESLVTLIGGCSLSQEQRFEVIKIFVNNPENQYGYQAIEYITKIGLSKKQEIEIIKIGLRVDISRLVFIGNKKIVSDDYYYSINNITDFLRIIEEKLENLIDSGLFSRQKFEVLYHLSKNQRFENAKYIFIEMLGEEELEFSHYSELDDSDIDTKKRITFLSSFGFGKKFIENFINNKDISQATFEDFCMYCLRIREILGVTFFERLDIDYSLLKDKKLDSLLNLFKKISHISQIFLVNEKEALADSIIFTISDLLDKRYDISSVLNDMKTKISDLLSGLASPIKISEDLKLSITKGNINFIINNLNEIFLTFFKIVFKTNGEGISNENIEDMEKIWGDLDVLFVLISRFSAKNEWHEEIPFLSRVVEIILSSGEVGFKNYKYYGLGGDKHDKKLSQNQLSGLNGESLDTWVSNPYSLKYVNTKNEGKISDDELFQIGRSEFLEQLIRQRHLDNVKDGLVNRLDLLREDDYRNEILFLKNGIKEKLKAKDLIKRFSILNENRGLSKKEIGEKCLLLLLYIARKNSNYSEFKYIIDVLRVGIHGIDLGKISNDLKSISTKLYPIESGEETIVFTTIFDDPKLLLEIGDLVNTYSCQNYRNGEWVQTLLGYVIDANIKGVISFSINAGDFDNNDDFNRLKEKIKSGKYILSFDAPKRILKVDDIEIKLSRAICRKILRLGSKNKKPVLFSEREYISTHFAGKYILEEVDLLINDFSNMMGIEKVGKCGASYARSKNPRGVYVDSLQGVQKGDYEI